MREPKNYSVFRNPNWCKECGWIRLTPKFVTRSYALESAAAMRSWRPQDNYIARKVR